MSEAVSNVVAIGGESAVAQRIRETGVLLEYPKWIAGSKRHDVVYGLVRGQVGTAPLAKYRLPTSMRGDKLIAPSVSNEDGLAVLPQLAKIADRIAPWLPIHIVPQILKKRSEGNDFARCEGSYEVDGDFYSSPGGLACSERAMVLLAFGNPVWMTHSMLHEIFHQLERRLSDAAREVLAWAVADGQDWPGGYYPSQSERMARLFEAWAWSRVEGMPPVSDADEMSIDGIFELIWSGGLADHQIIHGFVPDAAVHAARRGLELLPPPAPPPPGPAPVRHWSDRLADRVIAVAAAFDRLTRLQWPGNRAVA